jgi:hypothetical protein
VGNVLPRAGYAACVPAFDVDADEADDCAFELLKDGEYGARRDATGTVFAFSRFDAARIP